ncbi:CDC27 family protein [Catenovulum sp. 2E275]|uniref:tetratricopeptide repeat protein n=1 Tax=Catenovulum sp. 2E275 TaxID=2980497 RepID=UPI0021D0F7F5|nr:CDC27 family protein [Catenovulum sp. 2E275]MCU4676612.1 CDC27 family protein [Catenovulum sp. 2E275]
MYLLKKQIYTACLIILGGIAPFNVQAIDDRQKLIKLVEQQDYQAAYQLAERLFDLLAGDPNFDYLYGLSAYHSGHLQESIFAFERALLARPQDTNIRYTLAVAYYQVHNYEAAKREFTILKNQTEYNSTISSNSQQYLANMTQEPAAQLAKNFIANIQLGLGYDSNALAALAEDVYPLPLPSPNSVLTKASDSDGVLHSFGADILYLKPLEASSSVFASAKFKRNNYASADDFTITKLNIAGGYMHKWQNLSGQVSGLYQKFWLADSAYQDLYALLGKLSWHYSAQHEFAVSSQFSTANNQADNNPDLQSLSFKLSHSYRFEQQKLTSYFTHGTQEVDNSDSDSQHFERQLNAIGVNWQTQLKDLGLLTLNLQHQSIEHDAVNQTLGMNSAVSDQKRRDHLNSFELGFEYKLSDKWQWQNSLTLSSRNSNYKFYNLDRSAIISQLNYKF